MADICTKAEVITLAFSRTGIAESRIEDGMIAAISERHLIKILSEDFYDDVIVNPASYTALLVYLKPVVAWFVKFYILPEIYTEISNTGLNKVPGNNRVAGTMDDLGSVRQSTLDNANLFVDRLTKYLNDNESSYPLYLRGANRANKIEISGGIISRKYDSEDDFYNETTD